MTTDPVVQRVTEVFTEEALRANDGKEVPLTSWPGGPVIGKATLKYVEGDKELRAEFQVDDAEWRELLRNPTPSVPEPSYIWNEPEGPGRVSPRECVGKAQEDMGKAWSTADYHEAVHHIRSSVDWLRRALEQMG